MLYRRPFTFALLFVLTSTLAFSGPSVNLNGYDWEGWTYREKLTFIEGVFMGLYVSTRMLLDRGDIQPYQFFSVIDMVTDTYLIEDIVAEVELFYARTGRRDYPIGVAVLLRKRLGNIPPWQGYIKE